MKENFYVPQGVEAAKDLAIVEVHDCCTGEIVDVERVLPRDDESLHERRREIEKAFQNGSPLYLCAICSKPVYLALASRSKRSGLHFRHYVDDGDCIARTRSGETKDQIEAQKRWGHEDLEATDGTISSVFRIAGNPVQFHILFIRVPEEGPDFARAFKASCDVFVQKLKKAALVAPTRTQSVQTDSTQNAR